MAQCQINYNFKKLKDNKIGDLILCSLCIARIVHLIAEHKILYSSFIMVDYIWLQNTVFIIYYGKLHLNTEYCIHHFYSRLHLITEYCIHHLLRQVTSDYRRQNTYSSFITANYIWLQNTEYCIHHLLRQITSDYRIQNTVFIIYYGKLRLIIEYRILYSSSITANYVWLQNTEYCIHHLLRQITSDYRIQNTVFIIYYGKLRLITEYRILYSSFITADYRWLQNTVVIIYYGKLQCHLVL